MGTRADFYIGRGETAEWIGSIAWDGYPEGIDKPVLIAKDEAEFRSAVANLMDGRDDATPPEAGWPWPWDDSGTTDFAYAYDVGRVHASSFGCEWFDPTARDDDETGGGENAAIFPDMSDRKNTTFGPRSGVFIFSA